MAKIMICDDAAFMRMMIKDILTKNGYEIAAEAENGAVAVEKYPDAKPDLVLMDITMPDMDGIQALKKIKEIDPNANIIMCSARDAGHGYRGNPVWRKGLYRKAVPGRACARGSKKSSRLI